MRKKFLIIIFLLCCVVLSAQRKIEKIITGTNLTTIQVDARNCFTLKIGTHSLPKVVIETSIEGEYKDEIIVSVFQEDEILIINPGLQSLFKIPNDKLGAHKVISIYLNILVPDNFKVDVLGGTTKTEVSGNIKALKVVLDGGSCNIKEFMGNAFVTTQKGDIFLETMGAQIDSESRYGTVTNQNIGTGNFKITLKSISGDIFITKPK